MKDQPDLTLLHELLNQLRFAHWKTDPRITVWRCDLEVRMSGEARGSERTVAP
jgi:hypothetical protein